MKKILIILILFITGIFIFGNNNDPNEKIIYDYYGFLSSPETLKDAYNISPKKVNFETFQGWYKNVTTAFVKDLKKNKDGTYSFRVHIGEYLGENGKKNEVSVYEVTMKIAGGKIIDSKSNLIDTFVEYKLPYKNQEVLIVDDIKQNAVIIYLEDKKKGNKKELKKLEYDRFGINIHDGKIIADLLLVQFSSFDYNGNIMIDLQSCKEAKITFANLYISPDNKYILSFGSDIMTGGGIALEVYNGKIISKIIFGEEYIISDIQFFKKDKEDYIKFKTEDINQKIETRGGIPKKETREVNLTVIVNNK